MKSRRTRERLYDALCVLVIVVVAVAAIAAMLARCQRQASRALVQDTRTVWSGIW